ncbi:GDSL-type esterase/lipase family protein [Micromonospora lupini]|uniref:SGNH/GDSL hydrolase family protein n=1 Tax=Micromonospora lupini TaxID=285679 RepID=UPI002252D24F|nr:GDSL-type esterase/lipase family protein [Micromonospora lupini]MCX5065973.1 GDSL-type esterase/lipase family protein [Micromonospora lupini]
MTSPMLEKLIRFQRPERVLPFAQNLRVQTLAGIFGADETEYRTALETLIRQRAAAAARLATDPQVRADLTNLPFRPGDHLVAIGESTTADRLSWFELLRVLLQTERSDLRLRFDNLAVSGATTTQVLATVPAIRRQSADWMFCMLGSNDSQRLDAADGPLLVSRSETLRNLAQLRARALPVAESRWLWLTPTPVDETRVAAFPFFRGAGITWTNADITDLSAALLDSDDVVIDSAPAVTTAGADAFTDDGLHPSTTTHEALAARVLSALARGTDR